MDYVRHTDVQRFVAHTAPLLLGHEAHNNLILGLCVELARDPNVFGAEPPVMRTVDGAGEPLIAALQTPPNRLIVAQSERLEAVDRLVAGLVAEGRALPGVIGPRPVAERFARGWAGRSGAGVFPGMDMRIYALTAVRPPAPAPGLMRRATEQDRPLLEAWFEAFHHEATPGAGPSNAAEAVGRWLSSPSRYLALWEDGAPVAMAGATGPTPNGIRIGAVYTPPAARRRGYASALVAALSQHQLDAGRRFCFLFTDLSNPTSNHIYQALGYEPVVEIADLRFSAP